jgi:feruloyl esterase
MHQRRSFAPVALATLFGLLGALVVATNPLTGGSATAAATTTTDPQPAQPGPLLACDDLIDFAYDATTITGAASVAAGALTQAGSEVGAHCLVTGQMNERVSPVDGQTYAIGFEMRLPVEWSGRFLYQGNGGIDGRVAPAVGAFSGGGVLRNGLQMGFAVISSDAGHNGSQNPLFGLDPQARLDYGYQAVGTLTPMAKALIAAAYGRGPDTSYIGGSSNGGRHTMVASTRYPDHYDGFLAISPGFNLPKAAVAQLWGAQQWAGIAADVTDLETAFPAEDRLVLAQAVLARCDGLDGLTDGMVQDLALCQEKFNIDRDVPTCAGSHAEDCLTHEQKRVIRRVFTGARASGGRFLYSSFPYDPGVATGGWAGWKFRNSVGARRDPVAVGFIFSTPPAEESILDDTLTYALDYDVDTQADSIFATDGIYTESAMSFMTPPDPSNLDAMQRNGAKMIVVHGASDGVFSPDDTEAWFRSVRSRYRGATKDFVRYFPVPGMGHSRGGPATDQFDGLTALVNWVEFGRAPQSLTASVRGTDNPGGANPDLPADWSDDRTRPLCRYPLVARYQGGDPESADSFACRPSRARG